MAFLRRGLGGVRRGLSGWAGMSAAEMQQQYRHEGYLVVPQLLKTHEINSLLDELLLICRGKRGLIPGMDPEVAKLSDDEVLKHYLCVHFPHKISPVVLELLKHKRRGSSAICLATNILRPTATAEVLKACIGSPNIKAMQSMMFVKGPGKRGQATHQDEFYIPTRDRSLCAVWIALDNVTIDNGCIWVIPGSHREGVIYPMKPVAWICIGHPYPETDYVPVELTPGSAVFFNGYLLHRSLPNVSTRFRRAFANHYMSAASLLPWTNDGRFKITNDLRDIVMVAGKDPYADFYPIVDITKPFLRAEVATADAHFNEVISRSKQ